MLSNWTGMLAFQLSGSLILSRSMSILHPQNWLPASLLLQSQLQPRQPLQKRTSPLHLLCSLFLVSAPAVTNSTSMLLKSQVLL
jgi:hypothetical protein